MIATGAIVMILCKKGIKEDNALVQRCSKVEDVKGYKSYQKDEMLLG